MKAKAGEDGDVELSGCVKEASLLDALRRLRFTESRTALSCPGGTSRGVKRKMHPWADGTISTCWNPPYRTHILT